MSMPLPYSNSALEGMTEPPPPCERGYPAHEQHLHPRFPSGWCTHCGAAPEQGCPYLEYDDEGREVER
jgi:hypothetical protein